MRARTSLVSLAAVAALAATACGGSSGSPSSSTGGSSAGNSGKVPVASAGFTESKVLAQMFALLLQKAGFQSSVTDVSSSEQFQSSLQKGTIAVVPEYVATYADQLNTIVNGPKAPTVSSPSLQKSLDALKRLATKQGLTPLEPTQAVDQNAFAVSMKYAQQHHLKTLTDLGKSHLPVKIAAGEECKTRPFCEPGLKKTYGIKVTGIDNLGVDTAQTKSAVQHGTDQLALVLTTDATVPDFKLVVLTDDKHLQNADNLIPIVNSKVLQAHPGISSALNVLAGVLTTNDLAQMNKKVDTERQQPVDVARAYLTSKGLL